MYSNRYLDPSLKNSMYQPVTMKLVVFIDCEDKEVCFRVRVVFAETHELSPFHIYFLHVNFTEFETDDHPVLYIVSHVIK